MHIFDDMVSVHIHVHVSLVTTCSIKDTPYVYMYICTGIHIVCTWLCTEYFIVEGETNQTMIFI